MAKIIRGYWDCSYCGKKTIDGLVDVCPGCGKRKSDNVKYYMGSPDDIVTESELNAAGISKEECDGEHKEWVCSYCSQLNNWADTKCNACGSDKESSEAEYGDIKEIAETEMISDMSNSQDAELFSESSMEKIQNRMNVSSEQLFNKLPIILVSIFTIVGLIIGLFPIKETTIVTGFSWNRCVYVEEYKTFEESGWTLPADARLQYSQTEFYAYQSVLDHYETKTRQASRQVLAGYESHSSYSDNGNGTFTEHTYQTPVYKTEYYTETYQEPVYRDEPVYKTKYYYEIDRWTVINEYPSSGNDKEPYWNTDYVLNKKQRDSNRKETYKITYTSEKDTYELPTDYETWKSAKEGDYVIITKCLFGIVYNRSELISE